MLTRTGLHCAEPFCTGSFSRAGRRIVLATIASLVLTTFEVPIATASAAPATKVGAVTHAARDTTDFSARRRYYRRGPSAAGMAFMGMAMGMVGAAIAEQRRRDYYENYGYYGYGPGPYYAPYGGPYYGPRYYYPPY